jgi:hypothetical protein
MKKEEKMVVKTDLTAKDAKNKRKTLRALRPLR